MFLPLMTASWPLQREPDDAARIRCRDRRCDIPASALTQDLTGQASVVDGDTLEIHGTRIRLWGVDAAERDQLCRGDDSLPYRCGALAANKLDAFIARRPVHCAPKEIDRYGRTVASCRAEVTDLGEWLVGGGLALDWPHFSKGRYNAAQRGAERAGRGMWVGSYVEPWSTEPASAPAAVPQSARTTPPLTRESRSNTRV